MLIQDTINKYDNSNMLCNVKRDEGMTLYIYGDTLSFQKRYYSSRTSYEKLYIDRYDLKIDKLNDTFIYARPVSDLSREFFKNRKQLRFKRQEFAIDSSLKFEKIVFHTTECFGTCNVYHLQVDSLKMFKLHREQVYSRVIGVPMDTAIQGYFTGQLNDKQFAKLLQALAASSIRTLKMNDATCCDGSISTIIVYFNGQRKYFKTMFPPTIASKLIEALYEMCEHSDGTKTSETFKLED
jgi:hypothetical protein